MAFGMKWNGRRAGVALLCLATFLSLVSLPFLSEVSEGRSAIGDLPDMVVRLGQDFARPSLVPFKSTGGRETMILKVDGVPFSVRIQPGMLRDELEALVNILAKPSVKSQYATGSELMFVGWEPDILPIRIEYRYVMAASLALALMGVYLLATPKAKP